MWAETCHALKEIKSQFPSLNYTPPPPANFNKPCLWYDVELGKRLVPFSCNALAWWPLQAAAFAQSPAVAGLGGSPASSRHRKLRAGV